MLRVWFVKLFDVAEKNFLVLVLTEKSCLHHWRTVALWTHGHRKMQPVS